MEPNQNETAVEQSPTTEQIHDAVRNEHHKSIKFGDREFPVKDLSYDDYIEFMSLAQPVITAVANSLEIKMKDGEPDIEFNPLGLDIEKIIMLAGRELPRLAWICLRSSDETMTLEQVKKIGRRPWQMAHVVLQQVIHNELVKEFANFFPQLAKDVQLLIPEAAKAMKPVSTQ